MMVVLILTQAAVTFTLIGWLMVKLRYISRTHLGILSGSAVRFELALIDIGCRLRLVRPVSLVCFDLRKLHELNAILGYATANAFFASIVQTRSGGGRRRDVRGQWGGDEIVCLFWSQHDAAGFVQRLRATMAALSEQLPATTRARLEAHTGGLVDGFHAAIVTIPNTRSPRRDATRGIDHANAIKNGGAQTGTRASSGVRGTVIEVLV